MQRSYRCNHKYGNGEPCGTPHFTEEELKELFIAAFNKVVDIKDEVIGNIRRLMEIAGANVELEKEQHSLEQELEIVVGMINDLVSENAHRAQDQSDYQKRYEALVDRYNTGEARYNEVTAQLEAKKARLEILRYELETLEKQDGPAVEFNEATWGAMVSLMRFIDLKSCNCLIRYSRFWPARDGKMGDVACPSAPWQVAQRLLTRASAPGSAACTVEARTAANTAR